MSSRAPPHLISFWWLFLKEMGAAFLANRHSRVSFWAVYKVTCGENSDFMFLNITDRRMKKLTTFEESMTKEAHKQTCQASDGEENLCWYSSWTSNKRYNYYLYLYVWLWAVWLGHHLLLKHLSWFQLPSTELKPQVIWGGGVMTQLMDGGSTMHTSVPWVLSVLCINVVNLMTDTGSIFIRCRL